MKNKLSVVALSMLLIMLLTNVTYANEDGVGSKAATEQEIFTLEEMLQYALEDERMAQAEYQAIMNSFDVSRPFSNIYKAEVKHEEEVVSLYEARGMVVPQFDPNAYVVIPDTLLETYQIGVDAEISNIAMYDLFLEQPLDEDVRLVFEALRDASVKHLAAFERALDRGENTGNNGSGQGLLDGNGSSNGNRGNRTGNNSGAGQGNNQINGQGSRGTALRKADGTGNNEECIID